MAIDYCLSDKGLLGVVIWTQARTLGSSRNPGYEVGTLLANDWMVDFGRELLKKDGYKNPETWLPYRRI